MPGLIRRGGKHSWQVSVSAGTDPRTGRRVPTWRTVRGTRKDAERVLADLLREATTGALVDPGRPPWRRGEVLGLRWEDVDFERGVLHVRRSLEERFRDLTR